MLTGTITPEDETFIETWENVSPTQNWVIRLDVRGDDRPERVAGPRRFMLTTKERIITQDRVEDVRNDPFLNGCFRPVVVPASVNVETNPNALSDDDILRIFRASTVAWDEYMKVVDSDATLQRMLSLADDADISLARFRELERRVKQIKGIRKTQKPEDYGAEAADYRDADPAPRKRKPAAR